MRTTAESHELLGGDSTATGPIAAGVAGLLAAWAAAGSLGVMAPPLRHLVTWLCLGVVLFVGKRGSPPFSTRLLSPFPFLVAAVAIAGLVWPLPLVNLLAVCLVLAALAKEKGSGVVSLDRCTPSQAISTGKRLPTPFPLMVAAFAAAGLAVYRLAYETIPALGWLVNRCVPGSAGLDLLVAMSAFYVAWLSYTPQPRRRKAIFAAMAIVGVHVVYLVTLAYAPLLLRAVPPAPVANSSDALPVWYWGDALRAAVPGNLPALAAILHAIVAALMLHEEKGSGVVSLSKSLGPACREPGKRLPTPFYLLLAAGIPVVTVFSWQAADLTGKRIVACRPSQIHWESPRFDQYGRDAAGGFGMLPVLVESLGGRWSFCDNLSAEDLAQADVLLVLHPDRPWFDAQRLRVRDFVAGGGALLVTEDVEERGTVPFLLRQKLGQSPPAAQQPLGRGSVTVVGDSAILSDLGLVDSYESAGRLLASLAAKAAGPYSWWRQMLGAVLLAGLVVLIVRRPAPGTLMLASAALGISLCACTAASAWFGRVLPDGRHAAHRIAYIDASHLEAHSGANWTDSGINGLAMTLIRNGYLPLLAHDLSAARLQRAALLVSIAPARPFSTTEREAVQAFVKEGGVFLCTVGAEDTEGSRTLLEDFGFHVPHSPSALNDKTPEVEPLGPLTVAWLADSARGSAAEVVFEAAWEVSCDAQNAAVRVRAPNSERSIVVIRPLGKGAVAVIADSKFALNKNLETAEGPAVQCGTRNAEFWRWLLSVLGGQTEYRE